MTYLTRRLSMGSSAFLLSLALTGGCGDSAHPLGSTGDAGRGSGSAGGGGTTSRGGAGGGGSGGGGAGTGAAGAAAGTGGAGATAGTGGAAGTAGATAGTGGAAGTAGAGATAGAGSGGRGGGAGAAAGRGGTGGAGGSGNGGGGSAGTSARGGTGGGGTGGTAAVTGAGGTPIVACLSVQLLDRSCTTDADCFAATNIADCCGRLQYIGLRTTAQSIYTGLEAQCQAAWPACTCVTRPTITDDGSTIKNGMSVGVTCHQGVCTTFVPACGGPCAAGLTCFSCQVSSGQYGACTTPCTDVAASSDCTNTAQPRCQMGASGNVDGTYCTATNVMCDTRAALSDCTGLMCAANQQVVNVRNPALGTIQCACVAQSSAGRCSDCTCGEPFCTSYGAHCSGYSLEKGLLCSLPG